LSSEWRDDDRLATELAVGPLVCGASPRCSSWTSLGFRQVGERIDEVDGFELIFKRVRPTSQFDSPRTSAGAGKTSVSELENGKHARL
jgi:hypothetical protein